jgi:dTDP-4-dehydrorhamnose 3,5-epimerase
MRKISTDFPEVWIIEPQIFKDNRGFFYESYSYKKLEALGFSYQFVQDNHSKSVKGTVRGLHFQTYPGQIKLIRCTKGVIWDVIVDIRPKSPNFKKWYGIELSEENSKQMLIPIGFAHGFSVLSEFAEVQYKTSNYYDPKIERGIRLDDPEINVDWKVNDLVLSERDQKNPTLSEYIRNNPDPFDP